MEKTDRDKMIAKFMGAEFYENDLLRLPKQPACLVSELKYDTSWDEIMPVVEKIETLGFRVKINTATAVIEEKYNSNSEKGYVFVLNAKKLIAVYEACAKWIDWYNKENKII